MNKQSREECMGIRLYRYADKGEFRIISMGSCLLSGITGGTRHWFASPVCPLQARPACRSRTASCYIMCVRYCMYYSLRARPTLVASVTIVISCSCRTRTTKSDNNVYSDQILGHLRNYLCEVKNILHDRACSSGFGESIFPTLPLQNLSVLDR